MRPPMRILSLVAMLLYGSGLAAALHRSAHHPAAGAKSACAAHVDDETASRHGESPAETGHVPTPQDNDQESDDCPECLLLLISGSTPPSAAFPLQLDAGWFAVFSVWDRPVETLLNRQSRPRAPPHRA